MKKNVPIWLLLIGLGWASTGLAQPLSVKAVNATTNPIVDSLVKSLVGEGITVTNIRCNLPQTSTAYGTFKNGMASVGIPKGLVMTTGAVSNVLGPNNSGSSGSDRSGPDGDANGFGGMTTGANLLDLLSTNAINDACVIQFDLRPASDSIEFNYVFASEEYNSFVGGNVNDIFGFFIKGPGIPTQTSLPANTSNIALIPGSTTPISINTVNKGFGINAEQNPNYYINNTTTVGDQPTTAQTADDVRVTQLQYDGLTVKLKAKIKVTPCENYTLILAIADVSDGIYDSGVFIEAGSLRSPGAKITPNSFFPRFKTGIEGCNQGKFTFSRPVGVPITQEVIARYEVRGTAVNDELTNGGDYNVSIGGSATYGKLIDTIVIASGVAEVEVLINVFQDNILDDNEAIVLRTKSQCPPYALLNDSIVLPIRERYAYNIKPDSMKVCIGTPVKLNGLNTDTTFREYYQWKKLNAAGDTINAPELSCDTCRRPIIVNPTENARYVLFARDSISSCPAKDTIEVKVFTYPRIRFQPTLCEPSSIPVVQFPQYNNDYSVCRGSFLCIRPNAVTSNGKLTYLWKADVNNPLQSSATLSDSVLRVTANQDAWFVFTATNELGCATTDSIYINVVSPPIFSFVPSRVSICFGDKVNLSPKLTASSLDGFETYTWTANKPNANINNTTVDSTFAQPKERTIYTLTVNKGPCELKQSLIVEVADSLNTAFTYSVPTEGDTIAPIAISFAGEVAPVGAEFKWSIMSVSSLGSSTQIVDTTIITTLTPSYNFRESGVYRVQLSALTTRGTLTCYDTTTTNIRISPENPMLINVITPEPKDGKNDVLKFVNQGVLTPIKGGMIKVYNRWGKEVYSSDNYQNDWDGKDLPSGTYFYHFTSPKLKIKVKSWLEILR